MGLDKNKLAGLNAIGFARNGPQAAVVVRKPKPPAPEPTLKVWPVFPGDDICPEWRELAAWALAAPAEAFVILPHRKAMYAAKASLRLAILEELAAVNGAVVVGLVYELRTMRAAWEGRR